MAEQRVQVLSRRLVLDAYLKVEKVTLRYPRYDGRLSTEITRFNIKRGDAVGVLLFDATDDSVILVEQFKWPVYEADGGWIVETLAGIIDAGETPEEAARREALEETGYLLEDLRPIARFYTSPGVLSEQVYLFFARVDNSRRVESGGGIEAEGEDIRCKRYRWDDLEEAIGRGEIVDAKTLIAIDWLRREREGKR